MNLASPLPKGESRTVLGVTPFHLFTMALLTLFALAMVGMYFFKMRRGCPFWAARIQTGITAARRSPPARGENSPAATAWR